MRRLALTLAVSAIAALALAPCAMAEFGIEAAAVSFTREDGSTENQAGFHPYAMTTELDINTIEEGGKEIPDGSFKDLIVDLPPGLVGDPHAVPRCSNADFLIVLQGGFSACPDSSAIGYISVRSTGGEAGGGDAAAVYNLVPPPGAAAKMGFHALGVAVTIEASVRPDGERNLFASVTNISQAEPVAGSELTLWGVPSHPSHDPFRGRCFGGVGNSFGDCPVDIPERPFLTLPRSCEGPLLTTFRARSWQDPGTWVEKTATSTAMSGCDKLGFAPRISSRPTTDQAESPSGLAFDLDIDDLGLTSTTGTADSDIEKAVVTLPAGVTINPSVAEGLLTCTPADYARERADSAPGEGCPEASKVGEVEVETPLLEGEILRGDVFAAQQDDPATTTPGAENPFDSLIAIYMVIRSPELGILVKQAGKVAPSEGAGATAGQLTTTFEDVPQIPFSDLRFRFRSGGRSPLITPPKCGTYTTRATFTPWANPDIPLPLSSDFQISRGVGGGPCPPGGPLPFAPGFTAGTLNNSAGSFSSFHMRLTRRDGDQDMVRFSSVLPPGVVGKIAGLQKCPQAAIDAAESRTGRQELASPSCPAGSEIGNTLAGAGVGSQLTYVPGKLYLAGPFRGNPLSVVAITPAVAGPFDAGTVAVQVGLVPNPVTAEIEVDGVASEPIPHILKGIPLKLRDLRIDVDRENFILNPTGCDPSRARATLVGGGSVFDLSPAGESAVSLADRFQAADCARLGFKPHLSLRLKGGTKRGDHPALQTVLRPRPGDANLKRTVVRLPRSAFLDHAHIRTICTRVQFAVDTCPKGAVYGHITAFTPLLDEPLKGPVYLRSSDNPLPDLVFDLKGVVEIEQAARIDSISGGIRATLPAIPDVPLSKVIVQMQGGKKGLIVNSRNLCARSSRAELGLTAHNAKQRKLRPVVQAVACGGKQSTQRPRSRG